MKITKRKNAVRTAAFVFALMTAVSGMTGTFAGAGIDSVMTVSAAQEGDVLVTYKYYFEGSWTVKGQSISNKRTACLYESDQPNDWKWESNAEICKAMGWVSCDGNLLYEREVSGIIVSGNMFSLNSGDNMVVYYVKTNQYGNLEERKAGSVTINSEVAFPLPADDETMYLKRYTRQGSANGVTTTVDNFRFENDRWEYIGAYDWKQPYNSDTQKLISLTRTEFDLNPYTYQANGKASSVQIYSTALNNEGTKTLVAELNGNDDFDLSLLVSTTKNTGYIAVRTQGGALLDPFYGMVSMYRYDMESGEWKCFYSQAAGKSGQVSANIMTLFPKAKTFSMLADKNVRELRIYKTVNGKKELIQTFDKKTFDGGWGAVTQTFNIENNKTAQGFCYGNEYEDYSWEADFDYTVESNYGSVVSSGIISGKFLANIPYATERVDGISFEDKEVLADLPDPISDETGAKILPELPPPAVDANGDGIEDSEQSCPIYLNESFEELEKGQHGNVYLYKNDDLIESYTAGEFDNGCFSIPEFDSHSSYFLKVDHVEGNNSLNNYYTMYRWDKNSCKWKFRVNNEATPVATVPITHAEFDVMGNQIKSVKLNLITGTNGREKSSTISTWSGSEFDTGVIKTSLSLQNTGTYEVWFEFENGFICYRYVGIDPVFYSFGSAITDTAYYNSAAGSEAETEMKKAGILKYLPTVPVTNAMADDVISVDGTTANGDAVHYEVTSDLNNGTVKLPMEGNFTITDTTAGYKADVEVKAADGILQASVTDKSSVDDRYINLITPIEINDYTVSAPNGSLIETGTMKGKTLEVSDLNISADELKQQVSYASFTAENGIINAAGGGAGSEVVENGYLAVTNNEIQKVMPESTIKGDINGDGKITVTDVVLLQKYLHNTTSYNAENFINADMNNDGNVNVFDLAFLKRELLNK